MDSLLTQLPIKSLFIKHATAIDPVNKFDKGASKSLTYLAERIGSCLKNTLKSPVQDYVDKVHTEFQLYVTDNNLPKGFKRLDEYWWAVLESTDNCYQNLCKLAFNVMIVAVTNVDAERGFSINKDILEGRSNMTEKTVISIRLVKDTILHYDKDSEKNIAKFPVAEEMLNVCSKAYQRYEADQVSKKELEELEKAEKEKELRNIEEQKKKMKKDEEKEKEKVLKIQLNAAKELVRKGHEKVDLGIKTSSMAYVMDGNSNVKEGVKRIDEIEKQLLEVRLHINQPNL